METYSEENYLKAIYNLSVSCKKSVLTNTVAESMKTKPSSATDMFKRLSKKKLIKYEKYKGVLLTSLGRKKALNIIRKHRLWELFLLEHLEFTWDEVHDVAEQLEHVNSTLLIKKLDEFLHYPDKDPHGAPIPDENGNISKIKSKTLDLIESGGHCIVVGVKGINPCLKGINPCYYLFQGF